MKLPPRTKAPGVEALDGLAHLAPEDEEMDDCRPISNEDTCAGCGRSVRAPAGEIAVEELERAEFPGSYTIVRHYGQTIPCALPHGS